MTSNANSLNWFEISVSDITRAKHFYESIFDMKMESQNMMGMEMAFFPAEPGSGKANGGLVQSPNHKPSTDGVKVYLNANPNMDTVMARVEAAGGKVVMPKMKISDEVGYMAFILDTEGNSIGIHSMN